ncbi:hypothetical protein ACQKGI_20055 [Peribacillus muralis]|uniref:hypothetical protein n=1 Tax=Peribacillus muralis TaxID=264697 RepID=UPI00380A85E2
MDKEGNVGLLSNLYFLRWVVDKKGIYMIINEELLEEFLINKPEGYKSHVQSLEKFINNKTGGENLLPEYYRGLNTSSIIESIKFYIELNNINSINRVKHYATAIKEYLSYLFSKGILINHEFYYEILLPSNEQGSYWYQVNYFISQNTNLNEQKSFNPLTKEEFKGIISACNLTINNKPVYKKQLIDRVFFEEFTSAFIIKLTVLLGLKYNVIRNIKYMDLNLTYNYLKISGYKVILSSHMRDDFVKYEEVIKGIENIGNREYLLCEFDGNILNTQTSKSANYLKKISGRSDLNGLLQYAITKMMENGIDSFVIKNFTGNKDKVISKVQESLFSENKDEYLNTKLLNLTMVP